MHRHSRYRWPNVVKKCGQIYATSFNKDRQKVTHAQAVQQRRAEVAAGVGAITARTICVYAFSSRYVHLLSGLLISKSSGCPLAGLHPSLPPAPPRCSAAPPSPDADLNACAVMV
ncbi:hypothetical protein EVAR_14650_1 [Eumeta japonica]|uniref:Uncharacterized protein n=1 Tax=Eumeta variegata TaxID=151549 RepID=A0A4C1U264_EUMVA|nr:hypothetical protein EVAR_14650_1 [Eumeta japonica]